MNRILLCSKYEHELGLALFRLETRSDISSRANLRRYTITTVRPSVVVDGHWANGRLVAVSRPFLFLVVPWKSRIHRRRLASLWAHQSSMQRYLKAPTDVSVEALKLEDITLVITRGSTLRLLGMDYSF